MKRRVLIHLLVLALVIISVSFTLFLVYSYQVPELAPNMVVNVIDGDTFEIYYSSGEVKIIRLLCVDTPEKDEPGYEEAKDYLKALILDKEIIIVPSVTDKDVYNRALRYIYINDSGNLLFVNKLILDNNYGKLLIIPPETCDEMK